MEHLNNLDLVKKKLFLKQTKIVARRKHANFALIFSNYVVTHLDNKIYTKIKIILN